MMLSVTFASDALTTDRVTLHCIIGGIHKVTSGFAMLDIGSSLLRKH